jgi:hypothetical protein
MDAGFARLRARCGLGRFTTYRSCGISLIVFAVTFGIFHTFLTNTANAHGGDAPAAATGPVIAPRAEARSGPLELVAVYSRDTLALFVTRYGDGVPVAGAQVEGGSELETVTFQETDPGVYVTHELVIPPGRNDLKVTITQDGAPVRTQAMSLMIQGGAMAATAAAAPPAGRNNPWLIGLSVLAVYLTVTVAFLLARRQGKLADGRRPVWLAMRAFARRLRPARRSMPGQANPVA